MMARRTIIVIDDFYRDPYAVRNYALTRDYYLPYEREADVRAGRVRPTWWASRFLPVDECPFKSSRSLVSVLEAAVGERIDLDHWRARFPVAADATPLVSPDAPAPTCLWNCCFHIKPDSGEQVGQWVHNHVTADGWNSVGRNGWTGIIYLSPDAPAERGLRLWRNINATQQLDYMTPAENWRPTDSFANQFNRLTLIRGDIPHSGAPGWGDSIETGRMYQTFFFRVLPQSIPWPAVDFPEEA